MAPAALAFVVFGTPIGHCALVWDETGAIVGSTLPQGGEDQVRRAVRQWYPSATESAPQQEVADVAARVARLLDGGTEPLADVRLDLSVVAPFDRRVYEVVLAVPPGETLTYGEVAARLGAPGAAQAVGQALGRNPFPPIVPCHRVLAAGRKVGGFSARGGPRTKLRMLEAEGVYLEQPALFDL